MQRDRVHFCFDCSDAWIVVMSCSSSFFFLLVVVVVASMVSCVGVRLVRVCFFFHVIVVVVLVRVICRCSNVAVFLPLPLPRCQRDVKSPPCLKLSLLCPFCLLRHLKQYTSGVRGGVCAGAVRASDALSTDRPFPIDAWIMTRSSRVMPLNPGSYQIDDFR